MAGEEHPKAPEGNEPPNRAISQIYTERAPSFNHPESAAIWAWLRHLTKTLKATRVYERNNEMLKQFLDRAYEGLVDIHNTQPEFTLSVRQQKLFFHGDPVHESDDRQEGLPFNLYRNGLRRITFLKGMTLDELFAFMTAVTQDSVKFDAAGEDLVTSLWKLQLPHLRYFALDALSGSLEGFAGESSEARENLERLQADVDNFVAALYGVAEDDDDVVRGVSITPEDLEALKGIREEREEDLDLLNAATQRAIADIPSEDLERFRAAMGPESADRDVTRLLEFFVVQACEALRGETPAISLIEKLVDSLLIALRFDHLARLAWSLRDRVIDPRTGPAAQAVLTALAGDARIFQLLSNLNPTSTPQQARDVFRFLEALGPDATPSLIRVLDELPDAHVRTAVVELARRVGGVDAQALSEKIEHAKPFIVPDLLLLAEKLPKREQAPILLSALDHKYPKVRAQALGLLTDHPMGAADELLAKAMDDPDLEVRLRAYRVAATRGSKAAMLHMKKIFRRPNVWDLDEREQRTLIAAYGAIGKNESIEFLSSILNAGFLSRAKMLDAQIAAAYALAQIGTEPAMAAIQKGSRTLNKKLREACRRALAKTQQEESAATTPADPSFDETLIHSTPSSHGTPDYLREAFESRKREKVLDAPPITSSGTSPGFSVSRRPQSRVDFIPPKAATPQPNDAISPPPEVPPLAQPRPQSVSLAPPRPATGSAPRGLTPTKPGGLPSMLPPPPKTPGAEENAKIPDLPPLPPIPPHRGQK